ncbi:HTH-type transcriptional regulator RutR [Halomonadaceae bacterium LMG 33818]
MTLAQIPRARRKCSTQQKHSRISLKRCEAILAAALKAFASHGLHGARLETIAEEAGLSKTNLLYYFPSKGKLYTAVLTRTLDDWLAPLKKFDESQNAMEVLDHYLTEKLVSSRDNPDAARLFCMEMLHGGPTIKHFMETELKQVVEAKKNVVVAWIAQGQLAPVDPYQLFYLLWAATQQYADYTPQMLALSGKDLNDREFFDAALATLRQTLLAGLAPKPSHDASPSGPL